jgi:hypothetical protein
MFRFRKRTPGFSQDFYKNINKKSGIMKIEELAYHKTPLGELILRRRTETLLQNKEVFEVKLGEEFLMSSLFTEGEKELSNLGLAELEGELDVVVGGLGLGYTAAAALENKNVRSLLVIDLFQEVIDWHRNKLVPLGKILSEDKRCEMRKGDFSSWRGRVSTFPIMKESSMPFCSILIIRPNIFSIKKTNPFTARKDSNRFGNK